MSLPATAAVSARCDVCGIPVDAEPFDVFGSVSEDAGNLPRRGEQKTLASFQLHAQYCGVLTSFAQFTNIFADDNTRILTPGYEWRILQNGKPLFPYNSIRMIVNPWGYNCFTFVARLDENARVEIAIRKDGSSAGAGGTPPIRHFAGRLIGRYWYNRTFGAETGPRRLAAHISDPLTEV